MSQSILMFSLGDKDTKAVCGENIYMSTSRISWKTIIQQWYNESRNWIYGKGPINGSVVGHYTQVILISTFETVFVGSYLQANKPPLVSDRKIPKND